MLRYPSEIEDKITPSPSEIEDKITRRGTPNPYAPPVQVRRGTAIRITLGTLGVIFIFGERIFKQRKAYPFFLLLYLIAWLSFAEGNPKAITPSYPFRR